MYCLVQVYYKPLFMMASSNGILEIFSALVAICMENSLVPGEFPTQRSVTQSFDVFFDLHLNDWLSKQWWGWWFETPLCPLWRHRNVLSILGPWPQCARVHGPSSWRNRQSRSGHLWSIHNRTPWVSAGVLCFCETIDQFHKESMGS